MLVAWMVYGTIVGVVFMGGAVLLERALRSLGRETRWIWLGAMLATALLPLAAWLEIGPGASEFAAESFRDAGAILRVTDGASPSAVLFSGALGFVWACASTGLLLSLGARLARVHRGRGDWNETELHGTRVLLADDVGPAVVGFLRSRIVLPDWIVGADATVARLIIAHEEEHLRRRDPALLLMGLLMVTAMPWNVPLWWMLRRMRLAVEVDCDSRVLRQGEWDVRTYGSILLEVGERRSRPGYSLAGFSFPRSTLEHRILAMTGGGKGSGALLSALLVLVVGGLLFTAWAIPAPNTLAHWVETGYWCQPQVTQPEIPQRVASLRG